MFESFSKEALHIDDIVVYLRNERTGSSTVRKCKFVGCITGFTKSKVKIAQLSDADEWVFPDTARYRGMVEIYPDDVIAVIISKVRGDYGCDTN